MNDLGSGISRAEEPAPRPDGPTTGSEAASGVSRSFSGGLRAETATVADGVTERPSPLSR